MSFTTMVQLIQKTWGELYNGPQTYDQLQRLRQLEKLEVQVKEEREKIMEIACEVADAIMRIQNPNMQCDIHDEDGGTSYTECAQEKFNEIYDVFCNEFYKEKSSHINDDIKTLIKVRSCYDFERFQDDSTAAMNEEEETIG